MVYIFFFLKKIRPKNSHDSFAQVHRDKCSFHLTSFFFPVSSSLRGVCKNKSVFRPVVEQNKHGKQNFELSRLMKP